jgi:Tol biopolymer transport system component
MLRRVAPLVGAVLLFAVPVAPAAGDVFNGRIAFTSMRTGPDFDIFTMTPAGDDVRALTVNERNDHQSDWHPGGMALAFRAQVDGRFQVWRMGAAGEDQRALVAPVAPEEASQPSWFPDATGLLFRRSGPVRRFPPAVFEAGPNGENPRELFSFAPERSWYPSWSPDMTKVLTAITLSEEGDTDRGIFVVDPVTDTRTQLFDVPDVLDSAPAWAPDGTRIAFETDADPLGTNPEHDREIFVMRADGTGVTQLTRNAGVHDEGPAWAPDGSQIAYTSGLENTQGDINVMTPAGVHLRRLTDSPGADESPDWQAIPAAETDRRCGDAGAATDVRAAGPGLRCSRARRIAERSSGRGMPDHLRRFDAFVQDFGGTLRVELVRRSGRRNEKLVTFLHPRPGVTPPA